MKKRVLIGVVVSNKMDKTIVVRVEKTIMHPIYKKFYKKHKKFMVHDPNSEANIGDLVRIEESRPISKNKRWVLLEVVKRGIQDNISE